MSNSLTKTFEVQEPNSYEHEGDKKKIVQIKILDILFDDQVCSLLYMQDLTKFKEDTDRDKRTENLMKASHVISDKIKAP